MSFDFPLNLADVCATLRTHGAIFPDDLDAGEYVRRQFDISPFPHIPELAIGMSAVVAVRWNAGDVRTVVTAPQLGQWIRDVISDAGNMTSFRIDTRDDSVCWLVNREYVDRATFDQLVALTPEQLDQLVQFAAAAV